MNLALMRCCATVPLFQQYEAATDSLLSRLGVGVVDLDFNCCGYPLRNSHFDAYVLSSARNLALAEEAQLDLLTVCSCCYGSLKQVRQLLRDDDRLRRTANAAMATEQLRCSGSARVRHLLQVLDEDVGLEAIEAARKVTFDGLKVACHYGCHLVRPSLVTRAEGGASPRMLDDLVEATGAESVAWSAKLDCCGSPVAGVNDELSRDLTATKLKSARESGAHVLCVVCPYCYLQLDGVQKTLVAERGIEELPIILVHQLVGSSLGIAPAELGLVPDQLPLRALGLAKRNGAPDD
jgi:heterodisulfide reductase subunit B